MIGRLAVVGDVHGESDRLARSLEWLHGQRVDAIVCTGDIADGRGCINRCCELLWDANVQTVAGNHDRWILQDRVRHLPDAHLHEELNDDSHAFLSHLPRQQVLETAHGPVLLCHGIGDDDLAKVWPGTEKTAIRRSDALDDLLEANHFRFLINGHMHFRVLIDFHNLVLLNAGTLKGERGGINLVDFDGGAVAAFEVRDTGAPQRVIEHALIGEHRRAWRNTQEFDADWTPAMLYA